MIYVIEQLISGEWQNVRRANGMPMMFSTYREAEANVRTLIAANRRAHYRVTKVRD